MSTGPITKTTCWLSVTLVGPMKLNDCLSRPLWMVSVLIWRPSFEVTSLVSANWTVGQSLIILLDQRVCQCTLDCFDKLPPSTPHLYSTSRHLEQAIFTSNWPTCRPNARIANWMIIVWPGQRHKHYHQQPALKLITLEVFILGTFGICHVYLGSAIIPDVFHIIK